MAEDRPVSLAQQQQQRPAQTPTGTHGFFTTLLSPLYGSPRNLPSRDSNGNLDSHITSPISSQDLFGGRSGVNTTPSASPTAALPSSRHPAEVGSAPLSQTQASEPPLDHSSIPSSAYLQKPGFLQSRNHFASPAITATEGGRKPMAANTVEAVAGSHKGHAQANPLQSSSGACAPHMLGYRQCLEVNPDYKTNCTWALDNYMMCKEDMAQ
ncbi:hypothetical protein ABL78_7972 [Leptomonas seymouri]|uniref:CHCH domain-containing protein n=1 Tax=Leptomonas seymouri TaxID=5684 RepID=A0A0N1P9I6_LEPSE|nr:hypothetical protein ABL78_7972 [Leptomonas seymouri]|eukprot:KPI83008.1 hypothetical protein ABL78_7972 [Leptomonas seymouri]